MSHRESWPRTDESHRAACHFCDALHEVPALKEGSEARCETCGAVLCRNRPSSLERVVAFGLAALVLMIVAHTFPFISLETRGARAEMTLVSAAAVLVEQGSGLLGLAVGIFTLVAPAVLAAGLVYVCLPLMWGRSWPGAARVTRLVQRLEQWAMVEVFFLGVLVSLLKLVKLADVHLGVAFWAMAAVMICLAGAMAGIDRRELWDRLEVAAQR